MCVFAHFVDFGVKFHHVGLTLRFCTYSYPPLNYPRNPIFVLSSDEKHRKVLKKRIEKHSLGLVPLRVNINHFFRLAHDVCNDLLSKRKNNDAFGRPCSWVTTIASQWEIENYEKQPIGDC